MGEMNHFQGTNNPHPIVGVDLLCGAGVLIEKLLMKVDGSILLTLAP